MKTVIVFENENLLVIYKPAGLATQSSRIGEKDVVSELKNYLKGGYVGVIHRLDQPVEGLLVLAKNSACAANLSKQVAEKGSGNGATNSEKNGAANSAESGTGFVKEYMAVVLGEPNIKKGRLEDYMIKKNASLAEIVPAGTKDAKKAVLNYEIAGSRETEAGKISLVRINLLTGRFHQIRLQMANAGMPLLGDKKYGNEKSLAASAVLGAGNVALCASRLAFNDPAKEKCRSNESKKGEMMEFCHEPEGDVFKLFREE